MATQTVLELERMTPQLGAIVRGVDLRESLDDGTTRDLKQAVLDHGVLYFRDQDLTREQYLEFMSRFGTPCIDPFAAVDQQIPPEFTITDMVTRQYAPATAVWHTDSSLVPAPASLMALRAIQMPPVGGDTCWASMYAAYDALSQPLRDMIDGLTAVHSAYKTIPLMKGADYGDLKVEMRNVHPVVRVHPETGRKALFVNELWTEKIEELDHRESDHVLALLFEHIKNPTFMVRWHWRQHDLAFWDNRCLQHYAVNDYSDERVMQKSLLTGDRPFGPR